MQYFQNTFETQQAIIYYCFFNLHDCIVKIKLATQLSKFKDHSTWPQVLVPAHQESGILKFQILVGQGQKQ